MGGEAGPDYQIFQINEIKAGGVLTGLTRLTGLVEGKSDRRNMKQMR
jgi:hypothetical protein